MSGNPSIMVICRMLSLFRRRRSIMPSLEEDNDDETKSKENNLFTTYYQNVTRREKRTNLESQLLNPGCLTAVLPEDDRKKEDSTSEKSQRINGDVCLLAESPFRILRVSSMNGSLLPG
ncbi:hypothetical protein RUM44_009379 [Polyplax serrata]|uniref:Uncharacterized protein n=1 Tax=Polyplax serrata TaxID=468196 RepID=A0ABR1ASI3_POLSC